MATRSARPPPATKTRPSGTSKRSPPTGRFIEKPLDAYEVSSDPLADKRARNGCEGRPYVAPLTNTRPSANTATETARAGPDAGRTTVLPLSPKEVSKE